LPGNFLKKIYPMKKFTDDIRAFVSQKQLALVGYSSNPKKFGHDVYKTLVDKGCTVYPVNPAGGITPNGDTIYTDVSAVPAEVDAFLLVTKPEVSRKVLEDLLTRNPGHLWIQQMSGSKEIREMLEGLPANIVYNRCILMHADPKGIHRFHRWLVGIFGRLGE
jgi:predicted CoA-binding protein